MKRRTREKLPPVPSGTEVEDMEWRDMTPYAKAIFEMLPEGVEDDWATTNGAFTFWMSTLVRDRARREFDRTPAHSALWRMRMHEVRRLEAVTESVTWKVLTALHRNICRESPRAQPEQVLLLLQRRLGALSREMAYAIKAGELVTDPASHDGI